MNRAYEIIKSNCQKYACIVIPISITNPLERINCLIEQLNEAHITSGCILFDFIISSGNSKERYASVEFNNGFVQNSFQYVDVNSEDPIKKQVSDFFRLNIDKIGIAALDSTQKALLIHGYNI